MPSERSPASSTTVPAWRQRLRDDLGEDPGRFLDRDLLSRPVAYQRVDDDHGRTRMEARADTDCSTAAALVAARIRGIDRLDRLSAWKAVERRLDRGPRPAVMELLEERERELEARGERPDRLADQDRHDPAPTESVVEWPDRDGNERSAAFSTGRAFGGPDGASDDESRDATSQNTAGRTTAPAAGIATDGGTDEA